MSRAGRAYRSTYVASNFGLEGIHESQPDELDGAGVESVSMDLGDRVANERFTGNMTRLSALSALIRRL